MKAYRSGSKSALFLIELIIAIVFFAVSSAICMNLFVQAHLTSGRSKDLTTAMTLAQNYAEEFKVLSPQERQLSFGSDDTAYFSFDAQGLPRKLDSLSVGDATLRVEFSYQADDDLTDQLQITVFRQGEGMPEQPLSLYELTVKSYHETEES